MALESCGLIVLNTTIPEVFRPLQALLAWPPPLCEVCPWGWPTWQPHTPSVPHSCLRKDSNGAPQRNQWWDSLWQNNIRCVITGRHILVKTSFSSAQTSVTLDMLFPIATPNTYQSLTCEHWMRTLRCRSRSLSWVNCRLMIGFCDEKALSLSLTWPSFSCPASLSAW